MANFNKINIDGVPYDVEDTTARNSVTEEAEARAQAISAETTARKSAIDQITKSVSDINAEIKDFAETFETENLIVSKNITYTDPVPVNDYFDGVKAKGPSGEYNILTPGDKFALLAGGSMASVLSFGAVGDGVTDDTQSLIAAFATGSPALFIPTGTYIISDSIRVYSNTYVLAAPGAIFKRSRTAENFSNLPPILCFGEYGSASFATEYNGVHDVTIEGLSFDMGYNAFCTGNDHGGSTVALSHTKNIRFINCSFYSAFNDHYLDVAGCFGTYIQNCYFEPGTYTGTSNYEAINVDYATQQGFPHFGSYDNTVDLNMYVTNCTFNNWTGTSAIIGNHTYISTSDTDYRHRNLVFTGNSFFCTGTSMFALRIIGCYNITFTGNTCTGTDGVSLQYCSATAISGNSMRDVQHYFVQVLSGISDSYDLNITGNCFTGTGDFALDSIHYLIMCGNSVRNTPTVNINAINGQVIDNQIDNFSSGFHISGQNVTYRNNQQTTINLID